MLEKKNLILLDPTSHAAGSVVRNLGDEIIKQGVERLLEDPANGGLSIAWESYECDSQRLNQGHVLVAGGNVIGPRRLRTRGSIWNPPKRLDTKVTAFGVGWWSYTPRIRAYEVSRIRDCLNRGGLQLVRDEYTAQILKQIGVMNVEILGCPTMFHHRSFGVTDLSDRDIVFTLTSYRRDISRDRRMITNLKNEVSRRNTSLNFFPQGDEDERYLKRVLAGDISDVKILPRSLDKFLEFSSLNKVEVVGNRLHFGMLSLSNHIPATIIAIDNRAKEMKRSFPHLPIVERYEESSPQDFIFEPPLNFDQNMLDYVDVIL